MFESIVTIGDKLHVITRRQFEGDLRRHFMGAVIGNTGSLVELEGLAMIYNEGSGEWIRQPETRRRIFSLAEAGHVVNRMPRSVEIDQLMYERIDGELLVTDGKEFELNINEFGARS